MRLIDADALHDALRKEKNWIVYRDAFQNVGYSYDQVHFAIDKAPTIEPKRGEWVEREVIDPIGKIMPMEQWQSARCSVCGKYHTTPYLYYFDNYNYCPNCGAIMTERSE